jgi:uncharacterized RDD family membrane protein YckC
MADDTSGQGLGFFSTPPQRPSAARAPVTPRPAAPVVEVADAGIFSRFTARSVDSMLIVVLLTMVLPTLPVSPRAQDMIVGYLGLFLWIFVEAALLAAWGTTPGKWIFGVTVRTRGGAKPDFGTAVHRGLGVWWQGLRAGLPIASLISAVRTWIQIRNYREATWDAETALVVNQRIRAWRLIALGLLVLGGLALVAIGIDEQP